MATRFDANIVSAARRLHDRRTAAHLDSLETSLRYSETLLVSYQNRAIRDVIKETYQTAGDAFSAIMPEMIKVSPATNVTNGVITNPADAWIIMEIAKSDYSWYATRITHNILKVLAGRDAMLAPTVSKPAFYQTSTQTLIIPLSITGVQAVISYIPQPSDMVAGSGQTSDIPISPVWDGEIVDRMVAMGTADAKSSLAL